MEKTIHVQVPATSANCGPGFDCLGLAVDLCNDFQYTISDRWSGFHLEVEGEGKEWLKPSGRNLAFASFIRVWNEVTNRRHIGIRIHMINRIPQSRGLGSSSTAIVAGVLAASVLTDRHFSKEELLAYANELEGHPDNVAPAIYGGFTVSIQEQGRPYTLRLEPKLPLQFIAVVPDQPLSTSLARKAIPASVPHQDAVFNESRSALLVAALAADRPEFLRFALEDRLHQPYRAHLIPGMEEVFAAGRDAGAWQCILSGAGSTLMAYAPVSADGDAIGDAMVRAFAARGQRACYHKLHLNREGAVVVEELLTDHWSRRK